MAPGGRSEGSDGAELGWPRALEFYPPQSRAVRCCGVVCRRCEWTGVEGVAPAWGLGPSGLERHGPDGRGGGGGAEGAPGCTCAGWQPGWDEPSGRGY